MRVNALGGGAGNVFEGQGVAEMARVVESGNWEREAGRLLASTATSMSTTPSASLIVVLAMYSHLVVIEISGGRACPAIASARIVALGAGMNFDHDAASVNPYTSHYMHLRGLAV
jgi:hypothetical protein